MAQILAIDYGTKRCGVASTDDMQLIASALTTLATNDLLPFLKKYCSEQNVVLIVVGQPKQMNNSPSENEVHIQQFLEKLHKELPHILIERYDERFTSKIAFQTMIDSGISKKQRQNKALIDEISAVLILQGYMERHLKN